MGLLDILRGVADQADFIPGVDPNKDSRGLISQLLGMNKQPLNPSGVPPIVPQNAVQKPSVQAPGGAMPNPFQQYSKPRGAFARMLTPNSYDRQYDAGHQNFLAEQSNRLTAQQAQQAAAQAREAANSQFTQNAQAGGFDPAEIARMSIARNANPEEFGKSFAGNFGFNSASEGSVYSQFGRNPTKVEKTFTPTDPSKLAIDQQNADSARLTAEASMHRAKNPSAQTVVNNNLPSNTPPSQYGQLPNGTMIDAPPGARPLGDGQYWVVENGQPVVKAADGSVAAADQAAADAKTQMREENRTVGSMMSSLLTLNENEAIPSMTRGNNIPAMIAQTGVGQFYDRMGSDFGGNPENAVARDQLKGLRMGALMNMISMSDVSARAMDSDAEMRAWLSAIEGDTIESALTKLHVLDSAYGTGTELDKALTDGVLPQELYNHVMQQVRNDPGTRSKLEKSQVLARVDRAVATGNLTPEEAQELLQLEGWSIDQNSWSNWTPGAQQ